MNPEHDDPELLGLSLQKMWGSSGQIAFTDASANNFSSAQFADIRLPQAAVCTLFFQAYINQGATGIVSVITLELNLGLGRTSTTIRRSYPLQPTPTTPLDVIIPSQPLQNCMATISGLGTSSTPGVNYVVSTVLQVSPISQYTLNREALKFGMALPGEAEGFDETRFEEAEAERPELVDAMRRIRSDEGQLLRLRRDDDDDDEPRSSPPPGVHPARHQLIMRVIDTLTERQGKPPTRAQVKKALERIDARSFGRLRP